MHWPRSIDLLIFIACASAVPGLCVYFLFSSCEFYYIYMCIYMEIDGRSWSIATHSSFPDASFICQHFSQIMTLLLSKYLNYGQFAREEIKDRWLEKIKNINSWGHKSCYSNNGSHSSLIWIKFRESEWVLTVDFWGTILVERSLPGLKLIWIFFFKQRAHN